MAFDPNKPVQRRDGRPARIVDKNYKPDGDDAAFMLAVITYANGEEGVCSYYPDGKVYDNGGESSWDLINVPVKRTVTVKRWLVVYNDGTVLVCCEPPPRGSREGAVFAVRELNITGTLTEGEGLTNG